MKKQITQPGSIFGVKTKDESPLIDPGETISDGRDYLVGLLNGFPVKYQYQPGDIRELELSDVVAEVVEENPELCADLYYFLSGRNPPGVEYQFLNLVQSKAEQKIQDILPMVIFCQGDD